MSMFYAQLKHKLISPESPRFKALLADDNKFSSYSSTAHNIVSSTGFKVLGYADMDAKKYFLIGKIGRFGDLIECPVSTDFLNMWREAAGADLQKQRMKKALKREDLVKFSLELKKFADAQMVESELTYF